MGAGVQGPPGPPGPQGIPAVADPNQVADTLSSQSSFLNKLTTSVVNNKDLSTSISQQILQSPASVTNTLAANLVFQNMVGNSLVNNSTVLGERIADGIISSKANTLELAAALVSQGNLLSDLSQTLSDPNLPYAKYIQGPPGSISNIKSAIQPISFLCDTMGNCKTPQFGSYLNFTNGNLLLNNNKGIPAFRVAGDGGPWITGFSGGQLGTYNDNTNVGNVAVKWDAQGNVIIGDITKTTGSLKVSGNAYLNNLYATGFLNANNNVSVNNTDGSSFTQLYMHLGSPGSDIGGTGTTDGSTFTITKNGPYKNTNGGQNSIVFNNYSNPFIFGDSSTSGNIFMLNNNDNIAALPNGQQWVSTFTGNNTSGNNSAIINNTGTMGTMVGSLMLIGNAYGNNTGNRVVSVADTLQIGDWQLYQNNKGSLEIKNTKDSTKKLTLDSGLDVSSSNINGVTIRDTNINGVAIRSGFINASGDITANNIKGNNVDITGSINAFNVTAKNDVRGRYIYSEEFIKAGGDIELNDSIRTRSGTLNLRVGRINAHGDIDFVGVNNSIRSGGTNRLHLRLGEMIVDGRARHFGGKGLCDRDGCG